MSILALDTGSIAHPRRSVSMIMRLVIVALLPGILLYSLIIDSRLPGNLLLASLSALMFEAALVRLRGRSVLPALKDTSVVVGAVLLVLCVPQGLPVWQLVFGVFVLCTLGKHVFGGLGQNPFNPAMVAYAVLIVSFPLNMTQWNTQNGLLDSVVAEQRQGTSDEQSANDWDGVSGATPLDRIRALKRDSRALQINDSGLLPGTNRSTALYENSSDLATDDITQPPPDIKPSSLILDSDWLWLSVAWLFGGIYLLLMRVISWRIPASFLLTLVFLYMLYGVFSSVPVLPPLPALFSGAIMLGAFFIATDPVSAATSNPGKIVYGAGTGILCFVIREFSAYPEGVAFAVLLMNMCVPLIDHAFTRNRAMT